MTAEEYSASVASWLEQAYHLQMLAVGFPSYVAYQAFLSTQQQNQRQQQHQGHSLALVQYLSCSMYTRIRCSDCSLLLDMESNKGRSELL